MVWAAEIFNDVKNQTSSVFCKTRTYRYSCEISSDLKYDLFNQVTVCRLKIGIVEANRHHFWMICVLRVRTVILLEVSLKQLVIELITTEGACTQSISLVLEIFDSWENNILERHTKFAWHQVILFPHFFVEILGHFHFWLGHEHIIGFKTLGRGELLVITFFQVLIMLQLFENLLG